MAVSHRPAMAGSDSIVAFGMGTHTTVQYRSSFGQTESAVGFGQGLNARLRLLYIFGLEFGYDYNQLNSRDDFSVSAPALSWSGLLYLIPTKYFSLYLHGGLGGKSFSDIFSYKGGATSYHAGSGLEVYVGRHWTVTADFRIHVPGVTTVMTRSLKQGMNGTPPPTATEQYNFKNYQLSFGIKYYI